MVDAAQRRQAIEPREISQESNTQLRITWADDRVCDYNAAALRRVCPCAQCVNEWTGERVLRPETISPELTIADMNVVGRYALSFRWSDGHEHGIYSFKYLRELCEQDRTVVLVSHALGTIEQLCDQAIWMDHGVLRMWDEPESVISAYTDFLEVGEDVVTMEDV